MVILDTNLIIDHLRRPNSSMSLLRKITHTYGVANLGISTISVQELFVGQTSADSDQAAIITETIAPFKICHHDMTIARKAGELMRESKTGLAFADAAIAATTLSRQASLATLNQKDFRDIAGLQLLDLAVLS